MHRPNRLVILGVAVGLALTGCAPTDDRPPVATDRPSPTISAVATPLSSPTAQMAATAGSVEQALAREGLSLSQSVQPYRPAEPSELMSAMRAVYRVSLSDPNEGAVVIYEFADARTALDRGRIFARYLGSGFGQTNYPLDAQFSLAQVGSTLVFVTWSRELAADAERSERAFEAIRSVGQAIPVAK